MLLLQLLGLECLTSESVEGSSLTLQSIDDIHGGDGLPLGMLGVGDSITDDVLKEHLQDTTGLLVDESRDTLHSTTTSQTADRRLGDALDVITQYLAMTLGASLSQSLSSFSSSRHVDKCSNGLDLMLHCSVGDAYIERLLMNINEVTKGLDLGKSPSSCKATPSARILEKCLQAKYANELDYKSTQMGHFLLIQF